MALPLLAGSVYSFTNLDEAGRLLGAVGVIDRVGVLVAGALALRAYDLVVRGPDRGVVDVHPVRAHAYVAARARRIAGEAAPVLVTAWVSLVPMRPDPLVVLGGAVLLAGAWAAGLGVGLGVNLAAPSLAVRPAFAGVLDAVRGQNPRAQAALIWAPAVSLAVAGLAVVAGGAGLQAAVAGDPRGWFGLLVPFAVAAAGLRLAFVDGDTLARIPAVLGDVDAAYAAVEEAEEGRRVYLEWIVPWAPGLVRPHLLRMLRGGWRAERGWIGGSFVAALLTAAAGWTTNPALVGRPVQVGGLAVVGLGLILARLRKRDPAWLAASLPVVGLRRAQFAALVAWGQPIVLAGAAALTVRQGLAGLGVAGRLEAMLLVSAALAARLPAVGYVPAALVIWALGVWA